jgi:hypothetical protein
LVEYSYDPDDRYDSRRDDRRDEMRREQMIRDAMREIDRAQRTPERPIREERESQADFYARTQPGVFDSEGRRIVPVQEVINNPAIKMTESQKKAVNDPKKMMNNQGRIVKATTGRSQGRQAIRSSGQFTNTGIPLPTKRTRKKTKMDRTMSRCLKEANARGKLKNGKFRKGWDQSRIMTFAHKLCKRSSN